MLVDVAEVILIRGEYTRRKTSETLFEKVYPQRVKPSNLLVCGQPQRAT